MPFTITTWNVQNFAQSDAVYADKLDFLAGTLQVIDPDVVALQEILDENALEDLADRLGYEHVAAPPDGRGIRVAFLTRNAPVGAPREIDQWQLPPNVEVHEFDSDGTMSVVAAFPRAALQITVSHGGRQIDIINTHLKSKLLSFGGNFSTANETLRARTAYFALQRRAAEAVTLREEVSTLLEAGREVVLLGDLNDGPDAATTQILYGPPNGQPNGPEDETKASGAFQRPDNDDPRRMFNVVRFVPIKVRWSRKFNGEGEMLDQILASEGLMPRQGTLRQVPTITIYNEDTPNLVGPHPTVGGVIPDHAPVTAAFV